MLLIERSFNIERALRKLREDLPESRSVFLRFRGERENLEISYDHREQEKREKE